jgi:hypothetical protein
MKKTLSIITILLVVSLSCLAQAAEKKGSIEITNSRRNDALLELTCRVRVNAEDNDSNTNIFLIFFVADERTANLKVSNVKRTDARSGFAKFLRVMQADETLVTELSVKGLDQNLVVYPVLLQGDLSRFERTVILVDGEFSKINDALNVLYKSHYKPLAYSELAGL